jgi:hypothetical protein
VPGRWVDAIDLRPGDVVLVRDGGYEKIEEVTYRDGAERVYNFQVEGLHCYAVGLNGVLVHNTDGPCGGGRARRDAQRDMAHEDGMLDQRDRGFYGGEGVVYQVPGSGTPSGRPYIGTANDLRQRAATATDGRDRSQAQAIGSYPIDNMPVRRGAEQAAIDAAGGIANLDNRRNEVRRR